MTRMQACPEVLVHCISSAVPLVFLFAATASAQPVRSFDRLQGVLESGVRIFIDEGSGRQTAGRFVRATPDEITIDTNRGEQRFAREQVRTVAARERFTQIGTFIGAAVGAAIGAYDYCRGAGKHPECADAMVLYGGIGCGIGALAGLAIPRTRIIYRAPGAVVHLHPLVGPRTAGAIVTTGW